MSFYKGDQPGMTPGILPGPPPGGPYYWWLGGAMWGTMIDYWHYTGDDTWNEQATEAILFQADPPMNSFMHHNWSLQLGNDDQAFWGMAAMLAAEVAFPNPPKEKAQWLMLAQAVFNTQVAPDRNDDECGGGLRWQIYFSNPGYMYKNVIANACIFNIGARLARYTDNSTYAELAAEYFDWMVNVGYITDDYKVYDGGHTFNEGEYKNCTDINKVQYSANPAILIHGAAIMYNYVGFTPSFTLPPPKPT